MRPATGQGTSAAATAAAGGRDAVGRACAEAVAGIAGEPGLVLAFVSGEMDFEGAAGALQDAAGEGTPTAGLTGKGLISKEGPLDEGCVAMAFGPQVAATVAVARDASADLRAAGRESTREAIDSHTGDPEVVMLFIDLTTGDLADTVAGAYEAAGPAVPLAGGAAGGAEKHFFHRGETSSDSVVAVALSSEGRIAVGDTQTCSTMGTPSIVTRSEGHTVHELDGRPAEEVFLEQIGFGGVALDEPEFEALAITHPLAQPELHGDHRLRHVLGRDGRGGIVLGTHLPASAAVEFSELEFNELLASGRQSVIDAAGRLGDAEPQAAIVFDCAGRRRALRDGLDREVEALTTAFGDEGPPVAGLYTNGEVARLRGAKGDRNHAVVTVAFG